MPDHHRIQWCPSSKPVKDGPERFIRGQVAMKAHLVEHRDGHRQHQPAAWRKCGGATAAKHAGESNRGQHNQSIEPSRPTRAAVLQSPINA